MSSNNEGSSGWEIFSDIIGWTYFTAWSISFYPQLYTNWSRKKVTGLSFDFELYNILGFSCLAVYYTNLAWNPVVIEEYKERYNGEEPQVAINDPVFAYHALVLTLLHWVQIAVYDRGRQKVSYLCFTLVGLALVSIGIWTIFAAYGYSTWLDLLYYVSYVKIGVTLIKYIPQAVMNFLRKSTVGWNIINPILDFTGGTLSILQLVIDSWVADDWSAIVGNIPKFLLGFISIAFDILFLTQHYILYPERSEPSHKDSPYDSLIAASDDEISENWTVSNNSHYYEQGIGNSNDSFTWAKKKIKVFVSQEYID